MRNFYCFLRAIGSVEELKLYKILEDERRGRGGGRVILNTQLSTFIDPHWEDDARYKEACLYGRVILASVSKNKSCPLQIAILSKRDRYSVECKELLEKYGACVISGDLPDDLEYLQTQITRSINNGVARSLQTKRLINDGENLLARLVKQGLIFDDIPYAFADDKEFNVHHEIALNAVIGVEPSTLNCIDEAPRFGADELSDFAKKSRFDVLVTTRLPQGTPVIALEYDGDRWHTTPKGKLRDAKKNELCKLSGLPLVRVRCKDLPTRQDQVGGDIEKHELFRELVSYVTGLIAFTKKQTIERESGFRDGQDRIEWQIEFGDSPERCEAERTLVENYFREEFAEKGLVLSKILFDLNEDGLIVKASILDGGTGKMVLNIATPRFQIDVIGRELHGIDDMMKSFGMTWLYDKIVSSEACVRR